MKTADIQIGEEYVTGRSKYTVMHDRVRALAKVSGHGGRGRFIKVMYLTLDGEDRYESTCRPQEITETWASYVERREQRRREQAEREAARSAERAPIEAALIDAGIADIARVEHAARHTRRDGLIVTVYLETEADKATFIDVLTR